MCTNDFYLCKDSSRINCTLACSTLGYIPCKNYVDKKICGSVNRKLNTANKQHLLMNDDKFKFSNLLSRTFKGSDFGDKRYFASNDQFLYTLLGSIFFISVLVFIILFGVLYHRHKRKIQRQMLLATRRSTENANNTNNNNNHNAPIPSVYNQFNNNIRSSSLSNSLSNSSRPSSDLFCYDESSSAKNCNKKYATLGSGGGKNKLKLKRDEFICNKSQLPYKITDSNVNKFKKKFYPQTYLFKLIKIIYSRNTCSIMEFY